MGDFTLSEDGWNGWQLKSGYIVSSFRQMDKLLVKEKHHSIF